MNAEANPTSMAETEVNEPLLLRDDEGGVATLTLNRPAVRNCLSSGMLTALQDALDRIARDESVKVVVIAAEGPVFCAGHDLKELRAGSGREFFERIFAQSSRLMTSVVRLPKPVIAKVQGTATAAGCQLVATCDLAIASTGAKFCTPGVQIGLFCSTPMVALSRNVGRKRSMEMLLTGEMVSAEDAVDYGLINRAVAPDELDRAVDELAGKIAAKSPLIVAIGKKAFYRQLELGLSDAYDYTSRVMAGNMLARDAAEGIDAFLEKRPPVWEGR